MTVSFICYVICTTSYSTMLVINLKQYDDDDDEDDDDDDDNNDDDDDDDDDDKVNLSCAEAQLVLLRM